MTAGADTTGLIVRRKLSPGVRAGLDLARTLAAVYVVFHHTLQQLPAPFSYAFKFGPEAVLIFFLLSGFVIFANEEHRVHRPVGYYLRRLRRIYPPLIVAMLISTVVWALGWIPAEFSWESLFGTLFSLQDLPELRPGVIVEPYLGNSPLWSISYEVFFYLIFPAVMILWRRNPAVARWVIPAVSIVGYATFLVLPNHFSLVLSYFLMWWIGAMAAYLYQQREMKLRLAVPEIVGTVALIAVSAAGVMLFERAGSIAFPIGPLRSFAVGLLMFLVLFTPIRRLLAAVSFRVAGVAASVAGISYGLYVVHYPVLVQTYAYESLIWCVPAVAATILLAWVADKWIPSLLPRAPKH